MSFSVSKLIRPALTILSIVGYGFFVFAAAPTGGYNPAQTNDPACAPNDTDCFVKTLLVTTANTYNWIGQGSGGNGGSTDNTVFVGIGAGNNADLAAYSNFIGTDAGLNATNASNSNFFGQLAGCNATYADNANFFGKEAGCYATNANNSNFFGYRSGYQATNADHSTFFGDEAGINASSAYASSFVGSSAGANALNAYQSNFFGFDAGNGATNANDSSFLGYQAGMLATAASGSTFSGNMAGYEAVNASGSVFMGYQAGYKADGAENSIIIGYQTGYNDPLNPSVDFLGASQIPSFSTGGLVNFQGYQAGYGASAAVGSTFIGAQAGYKANHAPLSTFIGYQAGSNTNYQTGGYHGIIPDQGAAGSTFVGLLSGADASNARGSVFMGNLSGRNALNSLNSVFLGDQAGEGSTDAPESIFIGRNSAQGAINSAGSIFIGVQSGNSAPNAKQSIFIGGASGDGDFVSNSLLSIVYDSNTLVNGPFRKGELVRGLSSGAKGQVVSDNGTTLELAAVSGTFTPVEVIRQDANGANGNIDITADAISFTLGTASILIGNSTHTGGWTDSIALGSYAKNTASNQLMIGSTNSPINDLVITGSGFTTCSVDTISGAGISCSSDERLKKNISNLSSNVLDTLTKLKTVNFNWANGSDTANHIGFLAQDIQQYYPELVSTASNGYLQVNYAGITPVLVEAIRELNIKLNAIQTSAATVTDHVGLIAWFADAANGITDLFVKVLHSDSVQTKQLCIGNRCITEDQFSKLLDAQDISTSYGYGYGGTAQ